MQWTLRPHERFAHDTKDGYQEEDGGTAFFRLTRTPPIVEPRRGRLVRPSLHPSESAGRRIAELQSAVRAPELRPDHGDESLHRWIQRSVASDVVAVDELQLQLRRHRRERDLLPGQGLSHDDRSVRARATPGSSARAPKRSSSTMRARTSPHAHVPRGFQHAHELPVSLRPHGLQLPGASRQLAWRRRTSERGEHRPDAVGHSIADGCVVDHFAFAASATIVSENIDWKDRYIVDALVRRDASSLFGSRPSLVDVRPRISRVARVAGAVVVRSRARRIQAARVGWIGGKPSGVRRRSTRPTLCRTDWSAAPMTLGNAQLRPETVVETELGIDARAIPQDRLQAHVVQVGRARSDLLVPVAVVYGMSQQYQNAGTLVGQVVRGLR